MSIPEEISTRLMLIRILGNKRHHEPLWKKVEDHRMRTTALIRNKLKPYGLYIVDDIKVNKFTIEPILGPE
jgi:hypothetical protein